MSALQKLVCQCCGKEFTADHYRRTCSRSCAAILSAPHTLTHVCKTCGGEFVGGPRAIYCPSCRASRTASTNAAYRRSGTNRHIGSIDLCDRCGKPYTVSGGLQRFCPVCGKVNLSALNRDGAKAWRDANKDRYQSAKAAYTEDTKAHAKDAPVFCSVCGLPFDRQSAKQRTCPDCLKKNIAAVWRGCGDRAKARRAAVNAIINSPDSPITDADIAAIIDAFTVTVDFDSFRSPDGMIDGDRLRKHINQLKIDHKIRRGK